jgi:hypothetical protein
MRCPCRTSYTRFESGQQQSCRLWSRKLQVLGPQGPLLTNRMSELFTYGSVGGGGSNPAPYPAANAGGPRPLPIRTRWAARIAQFPRYVTRSHGRPL